MQRPPQYDDEVVSQPVQLNGKGGIVADYGGQDADDDMWRDAVKVVIENRKASTSLLQRRLRIGYGRAARLIEHHGRAGHYRPGRRLPPARSCTFDTLWTREWLIALWRSTILDKL